MATLDVEPVFTLKLFGEICQNNVEKSLGQQKNHGTVSKPKKSTLLFTSKLHGISVVLLDVNRLKDCHTGLACALFGDEINTRVWVWDIPLYIYRVIP